MLRLFKWCRHKKQITKKLAFSKITGIFLCILLFTTITQAKEVLPQGCKPLIIHGNLISISADKPRLIILHNLTKLDLWITHPVHDTHMSTGLSSRLEKDKWSALMMNHMSFELSCIESKPGHEQQVSCKHALSACEWPATNKHRKKEIFWAAENMKLAPLTAFISRKGWMVPPNEMR